METVLLMLVMGAVNVACFVIGAKVGQAVVKDEKVELSIPNPVTAVREHKEHREAKAEADRLAKIFENIENYDGTSAGQVDVPMRGSNGYN